jgi:hypothetical protein
VLQRSRAERAQDPEQGLRRSNPIPERQDMAQPSKMLLAKHRGLAGILAPAQHPGQHCQQHLIRRIAVMPGTQWSSTNFMGSRQLALTAGPPSPAV